MLNCYSNRRRQHESQAPQEQAGAQGASGAQDERRKRLERQRQGSEIWGRGSRGPEASSEGGAEQRWRRQDRRGSSRGGQGDQCSGRKEMIYPHRKKVRGCTPQETKTTYTCKLIYEYSHSNILEFSHS